MTITERVNSDSNVDYNATAGPQTEGGSARTKETAKGKSDTLLIPPMDDSKVESVMDSVMERELVEVDMSEIDAVTTMWDEEEEAVEVEVEKRPQHQNEKFF